MHLTTATESGREQRVLEANDCAVLGHAAALIVATLSDPVAAARELAQALEVLLAAAIGVHDLAGRLARAAVRVAHVEGVRALQRVERVVSERAERDGRGHVAVVEVDARAEVFAVRGEVDPGGDRAHGVLERERLAAAVRAAFDVVLLRRHDGARAVRRDHHRRPLGQDLFELLYREINGLR